MLSTRLIAKPTVKPALRVRQPSVEYVNMLRQSESEFSTYLREIESSNLFKRLVDEGIVVPVRFRGRIPRERYEDHMDRELVRFLNESGITAVEGWEQDLLSESAPRRIKELAEKYRVSAPTLSRFINYLRRTSRDDYVGSLGTSSIGGTGDDGEAADLLDFHAEPQTVDLSEVIQIASELVQRYRISETDFVAILAGEMTSEKLMQRYDCGLSEAEQVLDVARRVQFAEALEDRATSRGDAGPRSPEALAGSEPTALVSVGEDGDLQIHVREASPYASRYHIRRDALGKGLRKSREIDDLLTTLSYANQRLSVLSRVIHALCEYQKHYLVTGEPLALRPLSQSGLGRLSGEHPSTINRLVRHRSLDTPHGILPLRFLCQEKGAVIMRLVEKFPEKSDREIQQLLADRYNCEIARRTVAYHRGKRGGPRKQQFP